MKKIFLLFLLLWAVPVQASTDLQIAPLILRSEMSQRKQDISIHLNLPHKPVEELGENIYKQALIPTEVGFQGDYLRWNIEKCSYQTTVKETKNGYDVDLKYYLKYRTTLEEEREIRKELSNVPISGKKDSDKIKSICRYISGKLDYDKKMKNVDLYHGLKEQRGVCLTYSLMFYYLATEAQIPNRIITGYDHGEYHCWNITNGNGKTYHIDPTFYDSSKNSDYMYNTWDFFERNREMD